MTYNVRITFRSGMVIKGTTDTHPVMTEGNTGGIVTIRLTTKEWKDTKHIAIEEWDTIVNMADVSMVQCRKADE